MFSTFIRWSYGYIRFRIFLSHQKQKKKKKKKERKRKERKKERKKKDAYNN
jgi:hypothetical protein